MKISLIIPAYNSQSTLQKTVAALLNQTMMFSIQEIIVVDSSADPAAIIMADSLRSPLIQLVRLEKKTSPAEARNIGAGYATGDILGFIDSDVELAAAWVENILIAVRSGARIGGGGIALTKEQSLKWLPLAQYYLQVNETIAGGKTRKQLLVSSCNMFCERKLFEELGGFPNLRAAEDTMLCLKAGKLTSVWFIPEAVCYHIFREQWGGFLHNQTLLGRYIIIYRRRHFGDWYYRSFWPVLLLPLFLFIKMCRIFSRVFRTGPYHSFMFICSFPVFLAGFLAWAYGFFQGCFQKDQEPV